MENVKITFKNGEEIYAELNASTLIVETKPKFPTDLSVVMVTGEDWQREYRNVEIIECASLDNSFCFALYEVPESVIAERQMRANIDYIAMMADVDLEEV